MIEKRIMGGVIYSYPVPIQYWEHKDINSKSPYRENYPDEALYSCLIEQLNDQSEIDKVKNLMDRKYENFTHEDLYAMYDTLMGNQSPTKSYRSCNVTIGGIRAPYYFDVKYLMDDFLRFYNDDSISVDKRVILGHLYFETIHPFDDGNGRIGRLLMYHLSNVGYSKFLHQNISDYYTFLGYSGDDRVDRWIDFMLDMRPDL